MPNISGRASFMCWFDNDKAYGIILNWNNKMGNKQSILSYVSMPSNEVQFTFAHNTNFEQWMVKTNRMNEAEPSCDTVTHIGRLCADVVLAMSIERNGEAWEM